MNPGFIFGYFGFSLAVGWFYRAKRNRSFWIAFVASLLISPLLMFILAYFSSVKEEEESEKNERKAEYCSECGEQLEAQSRFCPECGSEV